MQSLNPELLTYLETCNRKYLWGRDYENEKIHPTELVRRAMAIALTETERQDRGEVAGEALISLAAERGIDTPHQNVYDIGIHHAVLADLLVTHLGRTESLPWYPAPTLDGWQSMCFIEGTRLHRIVLVDHWTDERLSAEAHSWYTLGEMAKYELPMVLHVFVLGASKFGRRYSSWTKGVLHPNNRKLRFERKAKKSEGFSESWIPIWREEHDEISREQWLDAMAADDQLDKLAIVKTIEPLKERRLVEIRSDMEAAQEEMASIVSTPRKRYSVCDWPVPCQFKRCCWNVVDLHPREVSDYRKK